MLFEVKGRLQSSGEREKRNAPFLCSMENVFFHRKFSLFFKEETKKTSTHVFALLPAPLCGSCCSWRCGLDALYSRARRSEAKSDNQSPEREGGEVDDDDDDESHVVVVAVVELFDLFRTRRPFHPRGLLLQPGRFAPDPPLRRQVQPLQRRRRRGAALDRKGDAAQLRFAALQSPAGRALLVAAAKRSPDDISSVVFVESPDTAFIRSEAVVRAAKAIGAPPALLAAALAGPLPLKARDSAYAAVADNRYSLFGKSDEERWTREGEEEGRFLV